MSSLPLLTEEVRAARRVIESLPNVELLTDLTWFHDSDSWGLHCRVTVEVENETLIPATTDWWVLLAPAYPWGQIAFHPAVSGGITGTFPHQGYNRIQNPSGRWMSGSLCLNAPQSAFGRNVYDPDPVGCPDRLGWYFRRAEEWLKAAADGTLLRDGDQFELPVFLPSREKPWTVAFIEDESTWDGWNKAEARVGLAELVRCGGDRNRLIAVAQFSDRDGTPIVSCDWGGRISASPEINERAVWVRAPELPVVPPYEAPHTLAELLSVFESQDDDLFVRLKQAVGLIRDGEPHILLLGFPIPGRVGEVPTRMYWQPAILPVVSCGQKYANGFRNNEEGFWQRDRKDVFRKDLKIDWQVGENWAPQYANCRGRVSDTLSSRRVLIVGAGAVGAVVAQLLVRGGVRDVVLCDDGRVAHGNLCRHIVGMSAIGLNKAESVGELLADSASGATVTSILKAFPPPGPADLDRIRECDLIVDCTGSDAALRAMAQFDWQSEKQFCSISLSYRARRAYVFTAAAKVFPIEAFEEQVSSWLQQDVDEYGEDRLVFDAPGCWHAAFPARIDDVWMLAAAAVRRLEEFVAGTQPERQLVVFEQMYDDESFHGIRRMYP